MRRVYLASCILAVVIGCGPSPGGIEPEVDTTAVDANGLKKMLEQIVNTGEAGSAAAGLRPSIEAINATDPGKGSGLLSDLGELEQATHPDEIKEVAKRMLDSL